MRSCKWLCIIFIFSLMIASCASKQEATEQPTRSSEDVLRTAEAIAEMTRQSSTNTPEPIPTEVTPSPTVVELSPTPEPTETPTSPKVRADYNANVRSGPDENYPVIDFILAGEEADVIGLNIHPTMGTWWYIKRIGQGLNGWVWGGAVTFSGDATGIPYFEAPPTPTATSKAAATAVETNTSEPEPSSSP
jgi:uncharacterized protein YgiM (DUF1202 family)